MHCCRRDSHARSRTAIYANIPQIGRIWVYCSCFWVALVGFVGVFGWFWVVLLVVLGRFGSFWVVLGGFGWFRVLVTTYCYGLQQGSKSEIDVSIVFSSVSLLALFFILLSVSR